MAYDGKVQEFAPVKVDEVGQTIMKARELLSDPAKWFQGDYVCQKTGATCILGALGFRLGGFKAFSGSKAEYQQAIDAEVLIEACLDGGRGVAGFNDDPNTTHAMVMDLLDRAASADGEMR